MIDFSEIKPYKKYNTTINGKSIVDGYNPSYYNEHILSLSADELIQLEKEWKDVDDYNKQVLTDNLKIETKLIKQIDEFFEDLGMPKYKRKGLKKTQYYTTEYAKFFEALKNKIGKQFGNKPDLNKLKYNKEDYDCGFYLKTLVEKVKYFKSQIQADQNDKKAKDMEYRLAISLAPKYGISLDDEMLLEKVREADKEQYIKEHFPDGTEMDISFCDGCETWHVGSHRCSCNNYRCYLQVDGSIGNWHAYAMWG